jgi:hypothetical protein
MALQYLKLATVTTMVASGELTKAALLASIAAGETIIVNLKGLMLTGTQVENHLAGRVDGDALVRT